MLQFSENSRYKILNYLRDTETEPLKEQMEDTQK